MELSEIKIGIIGTGKLASCCVQGWLASGNVAQSQFHLSCRSEESRRRLSEKWPKADVTSDNRALAENADLLLLGVKPYHLSDLLKEIEGSLRPESLVLSLAAGFSALELRQAVSSFDASARMGRLMLNTSVAFNKGILGLSDDLLLESYETDLLQSLGDLYQVSENDFDAFTVASASAPAFEFYWRKCFVEAMKATGLETKMAEQIALSQLRAEELHLSDSFDPQKWIEQIATPGGMTADGLRALEEGALPKLTQAAFESCLAKAKGLK